MQFSTNTREKYLATGIGYIGVFMWSLASLYIVVLANIPTFEIITAVFTISFCLAALKLSLFGQWRRILQPWPVWLIGTLGIYGNDLFYIAAFKYAPVVQADLINYLWPIFVIIFAGTLPSEKFTKRHLLAGCLGLASTYFIVTQGHGLAGFQVKYWFGYTLALIGAIVWSVYTLMTRHYGKAPVEMIGMYCGIGALSSFLLHLNFEQFVMPDIKQAMALLVMGLTTQGTAYFLWDYGVKKGNFKLLSLLTYGNPILSVSFLVIYGITTLTPALVTACLLLASAGIVASNPRELKRVVNFIKKNNQTQI